MLHKNPFIIAPATFALTQELQALPELEGFHLVGGTSLALQLGHRNSIDIDLFTHHEFNTNSLVDMLKNKGFKIEVSFQKGNALLSYINNIKVDFIRHNYPYIKPPITEEGITYLSMEDICAMKINAIHDSGKRLKDFIDIYFLLEHFSIKQMLDFFCIKYPNTNPVIPLRAITYFDDIDEDIDPPKLLHPISLDEIKNRIKDGVLHGGKIFR
ncbi:MAG: hypothetical protein RL065_1409 [Bacteroidota bacterium]